MFRQLILLIDNLTPRQIPKLSRGFLLAAYDDTGPLIAIIASEFGLIPDFLPLDSPAPNAGLFCWPRTGHATQELLRIRRHV